ncbi:hypothetical protein GGR52DRAFT_197625 [Hypoxylon sp. FL1284]|nr:hypothetical protein GGR52DRAFT_197625 [Hypoxylon sp. FL1284]
MDESFRVLRFGLFWVRFVMFVSYGIEVCTRHWVASGVELASWVTIVRGSILRSSLHISFAITLLSRDSTAARLFQRQQGEWVYHKRPKPRMSCSPTPDDGQVRCWCPTVCLCNHPQVYQAPELPTNTSSRCQLSPLRRTGSLCSTNRDWSGPTTNVLSSLSRNNSSRATTCLVVQRISASSSSMHQAQVDHRRYAALKADLLMLFLLPVSISRWQGSFVAGGPSSFRHPHIPRWNCQDSAHFY